MTRRSRPLALAAVAAAAAALVVLPSAALAHEPSLVWLTVYHDNEQEAIGTATKADATLAALPTDLPERTDVFGIDLLDEIGYGVGELPVGEGYGPAALYWDHTTGEITPGPLLAVTPAAVVAVLGEAPPYTDAWVTYVWGLDAAPGASILTIAQVGASYTTGGEFPTTVVGYYSVLAEVDMGTGALTPLVVLGGETEGDKSYYSDVATDPTTGIVYLFGYVEAELGEGSGPYPSVTVVDPGAGTVGAPAVLMGLVDAFDGSIGEAYAADFEDDGRLWITAGMYWTESDFLVSFAPGLTAGAAPATIGDLRDSGTEPYFDRLSTLAVESAPPGLPATGTEAPLALAGLAVVAVAAGAGAFALGRGRRRTA